MFFTTSYFGSPDEPLEDGGVGGEDDLVRAEQLPVVADQLDVEQVLGLPQVREGRGQVQVEVVPFQEEGLLGFGGGGGAHDFLAKEYPCPQAKIAFPGKIDVSKIERKKRNGIRVPLRGYP